MTHWRSFPGPRLVRPDFSRRSNAPPRMAGLAVIAAGENVLLLSPTGAGKTLAGFLAILDRLFRTQKDCVRLYLSAP